MKHVLIIGSGISGMACAISCAQGGAHVQLVSPAPSERSQSVMAAGGINAVTHNCEAGDSIACHVDDTLRGGSWLGGKNAVEGLCTHAESIISHLESIGTVFTVDSNGQPVLRSFGGQSHRRTHFCGSSTGKQIVSALVMEARRFEAKGLITRTLMRHFHSALIHDGVCYGALLFHAGSRTLEPVFADAVVMAVGGQNALFGKTTGSTLCDGYAAGKLFMQGAVLKNLEFIQYHPTTLETSQKRILISEAVRGEGGKLFYLECNKRVYFMSDKYGTDGDLMTRDVVSREIDALGKEVFLDASFLDKRLIDERLPEVRDLCAKYGGIDISKEPIPVAPSVHFFMGGLAVHLNHETSIKNLYAVGECASMYHGANRLGGNSLLAALYSGGVAADDIL
ncbi:MAG: FAD-binding protein, partial [Atopobiaceae bacterium]|nr:FAD-binding protein [Atopobiaceae bacterium]